MIHKTEKLFLDSSTDSECENRAGSKPKNKKRVKVEALVDMDAKLELQSKTILNDNQLARIAEIKNFYRESADSLNRQPLNEITEQSHKNPQDRKGKTPILPTEEENSFIEEFQIPWYISEALCFYPDTSSMAEIPYSVKRDRNLWFLCKETNYNWSNQNPLPNFAVGDQVEMKFLGKTRELRMLIKYTYKDESGWVFGRNYSERVPLENRFAHRADIADHRVKKFHFPASLSKHEAIDLFLESNDEYLKQLPSGFTTKAARKTLITDSFITPTTLVGKIGARPISYSLSENLLKFSLDSLKIFFCRSKDYHEFRIFFDTSFLESVMKDETVLGSLSGYFRDHLGTQLMNPELGNTLEFVPRSPNEGFGLQLYDYQKRSLQWMYQIEKKENSTSFITRGETTHLARFDSFQNAIINFSEASSINKRVPYFDQIDYTCLGGILADNPGYGKTITTLALIHSNPLDSFSSLPLTPVQKYYLFPSRATLIICPSNLVKQWQAEVKKCFPKKVRCYTISWIVEHRKLSWNDVIQADIIIISVSFLANQNYHKFLTQKYGKQITRRTFAFDRGPSVKTSEPYFASIMRKIVPMRKEVCDIPGEVNFEAVYWYRIVFDEFHELEIAERSARGIAKSLQGLYHWGMTGTPAFKSCSDIQISAEYLAVEFDSSYSSLPGRCLSFKSNFIRRNNEDLELPPLLDEIEWVKLSPPEMALYNVRSTNSEIEAFMACSHYQISDEVVSAAGDAILSIDAVSNLLCQRLIDTCAKLQEEIIETQNIIVEVRRELSRNRFDTPADKQRVKRELDRELETLGKKQTELDFKNRELYYFKGVMNALEKDSLDESCLICLDELRMEQNLCITKCGHVYCVNCVTSYLAAQFPTPKVCPKCRQILKREEVMMIDPQTAAARMNSEKSEGNAAEEVVDKEQLAKCGTKIAAMIRRLKQIKEENPSAKIIIFCQFRRLANIINSTLDENSVSVARVHGSHSTRNNAINEFKSNPECSVIMLSTEDSVSGLHLPETTHIFIMHPFWFGSSRDAVEKAISAEKQGIARAYRLGLKHPLKVIRFYTRDTIEETCSKDRSKL